ncbi:hypothetical protein M9Y10_009071 [Tritrichomonas musculus]|uniref:Dopey N-terminal domain-containing protein n=1 Tax=Tritrichomonas musculus TaxID=1915356 RepID=A0ABR2IZR2_9EUKA
MTSIEKDSFYQSIVEALKPTTSNQDLNRTLYNFQNQINAFIFTRYTLNDVPEIFRSIWKLLLSAAGNSSSTTRLASYRAAGAFLTRVTPYYPDKIHESFSDVTLMATIDVKSSAIIASSFAFISKYIATPFMKKFINQTPVFHHFSSNDPVFSEHLPTIISNLGHLGNDWLKNLLQFFLEKIDESTTASRYLIKAVTAIVGHNPRFFIRHIIDWMKTSSKENLKKKDDENDLEIDKKYISLFTFFISGHQKSIEDVDLYCFAKSASLLLNSNPNLTDIDSSFQMLSTPSNSFRVVVNDNNSTDDNSNKSIKITVIKTNLKLEDNSTVVDDENEKVEITIETEKLIRRPSFYMINLPLESLKPSPDDSNLVLGAKFKSISQYYTGQRIRQIDNEDRTLEVFDIYEPYLKRDYNETRSSALQGLALCINKFIEKVPSEKLKTPLQQILLAETISWFHSFDILRIIRNIQDYRLFIDKLGVDLFVLLLKQLIGFCFCDHESLSNESTLVLSDIVTMANLDIIVQAIHDKTDFFDSSSLKHSVSTMSAIIEKVNKIVCERKNIEYDDTFTLDNTDLYQKAYNRIPSIDFYSTQLIEASPLYFDNLVCLSEILHFFSIYKAKDMNKFKTVLNAAIFIILSTVEVISGQTVIVPDTLIQFINSAKYSNKSVVDPNNSPLISSPLSASASSSEIPRTSLQASSTLSDAARESLDSFKLIVQQDIFHKNIDIITESFSSNDYKSFIMPMKSALLCCFLYISPYDGFFLANVSHQLFPILCSKYYNNKWISFEENQHNKVLANIPRFLRYINDLHIHAEWCKICLKKIDIATTDDNYLTIVDFLAEIALNYFKTTIGTDPYLAAIFCQFLYGIHYGNASTVIQKYFDQVYKNTGDKKFFIKIAELYPESVELWPTSFEGITINPKETNEKKDEENDEKNKITLDELISKSKEIELNGIKIENIYKIENDQIQQLFEEIVKRDNLILLKQILSIADDRKIKLDLKLENTEDLLDYTKNAITIVVDYIARNKIKLSYKTFKNLTEHYLNQKRGAGATSFCSFEDDENENIEHDEGDLYLRFCLNNLRTIWGPYCTSLIEDDPSKLLDFLLKSKKIKKREVISLLCLVHKENIQFDLQSLYKLSVNLLLPSDSSKEAQNGELLGTGIKQISISRYRILLLFLAVIIQQIHFYFRKTNFLNPSSIVTLEFAHKFIQQISPDFERLPVEILSYLFLILAQTIPIDNDCVLFIWRLFMLCSCTQPGAVTFSTTQVLMTSYSTAVSTNIPSRSTPYGHLHQILIGLSSNTRLVGKNYVFGLADIILPCLQSKLPSRIMTGLRLVEQTCLSVAPSAMSYFIQKAIEVVIKKYRYILYYLPTTSEQVYRTFMSFLLKKNAAAQQQFFFHYLPDFTFISPHSGGFNISIAFYPAVFSLITPANCDNFAKIYQYICETLFKFPLGFTYALKSLIQYMKKLGEDERESVLVDQFVNWLKIVKDAKNRSSSYSEFNPEKENIKLFKTRSECNQIEPPPIQQATTQTHPHKEEKKRIKVSTSSSSLHDLEKQSSQRPSTPIAKKPKAKGFSILSLWGKKKDEKQPDAKEEAKKDETKKNEAKSEDNVITNEIDNENAAVEDVNAVKDIEVDMENISNENNVENVGETENETEGSESFNSSTEPLQSSSVNLTATASSSSSGTGDNQHPKPKKRPRRISNITKTYLTSFHQFYFGYTFCTNYKLTKQVGEWIDTCLIFMSPSKTFSILVFNLIRNIKFGVVYPNILKLFIENRDDEELNEMFDGIIDLPRCECHKVALKLFKTCDRYKEMIDLASFDQDCDESNKIIEELKCYLRA